MVKLTIAVNVVDIGEEHIAVCTLGGLVVRGRQAPDVRGAVRNLLWRLAGEDHDENAALGLALAISGRELDSIAAALNDARI